jgi:hypothetical protein
MKKIRFGIFGEDSATRIFMSAIIPKMIETIGTDVVFELMCMVQQKIE